MRDGNKTGMYINTVLLRKQKEADPTRLKLYPVDNARDGELEIRMTAFITLECV